MNSSGRTQPDRCPGVLAVHQAADGGLARVRLPGGVLSSAQLRVLAAASSELGDGNLELTSRGNIQIRALRPGAPRLLSDRLYAAGLLPSITHERVRNILASPLSGLDEHSLYDVLPLAAALDSLVCTTPALAALPGRFLFALDDGRGDMSAQGADVAVRVLPGGSHATLLLGGAQAAPQRGEGGDLPPRSGEPSGSRVQLEEVPSAMVAAAEAFLAERAAQGSEAWRIAELAGGAEAIYKRLGLTPTVSVEPGSSVVLAGSHGRALVVAVPLGSLSQEQAAVLSKLADEVRVTPWRSVVLAGVGADAVAELVTAGLVVESESPWNGVTACAGKPGCAKALADVRADAREVMPRIPGRQAVHWSGCERRCGKPTGGFVDLVALGKGYAIDGVPVDDELAQAVAAARGAR
ncbi:precorrin-3B synthase [Kribbella sp. NPDC006257]|uniref:precorrin-3B synthase n=1 Tax=Kribbella sp. NPDC006257 TaxID=3156738 RepID=UPI0033AFBF8E